MNTTLIDQSIDLIAAQVLQHDRPVVLTSFGKDSLVLHHLVQQVVPDVECLLLLQAPDLFPEKYAHAKRLIDEGHLTCWSIPPRWTVHTQLGDKFDLFQGYGSLTSGDLIMATGCRARELGEERYLCAKAMTEAVHPPDVEYPWDLTFHGHKASDPIPFASSFQITASVVKIGGTTLALPIRDWTDADIFAYIDRFDLPLDRARYEGKDERVNPDVLPTCWNCLDVRTRGQMVFCPLTATGEQPGHLIANVAQPAAYHRRVQQAILGDIGYADTRLPNVAAQEAGRWFGLEEAWPLFTVRKHVFADEGRVYVEVDDIPPVATRIDVSMALLHELHRLEFQCWRSGVSGWISANARENVAMARWIEAFGARRYRQDAAFDYFVKPVTAEPREAPSLRTMAKTLLAKRGTP